MEFGGKYNKMVFPYGKKFEELIKFTPFILYIKKKWEEKSFAQRAPSKFQAEQEPEDFIFKNPF